MLDFIQFVIDIDLLISMDSLESILADAIYGGQPPPIEFLRGMLKQHGLADRFQVVAVGGISEAAIARLTQRLSGVRGWWMLRPHSGLLYFSFNPPMEPFAAAWREAGLTAGPPKTCDAPRRWIATMQQAIVALREQELTRVRTGSDTRADWSAAQESQSRQLALQAIRREDMDWPAAVSVWMRMVLVRHTRQLNDVRRRLIEFVTELTRDIDHNIGLAYPFYEAIEQVYRTFAFPEFPDMAARIVRDLKPHLIRPPSQTASASMRWVNRTIEHLNEHADEPFHLDEMAARVHVSPSHLARTFKRHTGKTLVQYLHALRVGRAKDLLRRTDHTVLAVALESGFESAEHFHRIFKRLTAMTPSEYRAG